MRFLATAALITASLSPVSAANWLTRPSTFTHSATTGQRVAQHTPIVEPQTAITTPLHSSGYTNFRSSINFGQLADNYHRVERWGEPVRPYGEWRFPYRPFSVPYSQWGPPFAGFGTNVQSNVFAPTDQSGRFDPRTLPQQGGNPLFQSPGVGQGFGSGQGFGQGFGSGQGFNQGFGNRSGFGFGQGNRLGSGFGNAPFQGQSRILPDPYPRTRRDPSPVVPYADGYHPVYRE